MIYLTEASALDILIYFGAKLNLSILIDVRFTFIMKLSATVVHEDKKLIILPYSVYISSDAISYSTRDYLCLNTKLHLELYMI